MPSKIVTQEQKDAMAQAYLDGKSMAAAAAAFGLNRTAALNALKGKGIARRQGQGRFLPKSQLSEKQEADFASRLKNTELIASVSAGEYMKDSFSMIPSAYGGVPVSSGIYAIVHIESGKLYIGSAKRLRGRWAGHRSDLEKGKHHSQHLQHAWNRDGALAFEFRVIELVLDVNALLDREQHWIDATCCYRRELGFNMQPQAGSNLGVRATEETKAKLRELGKRRGARSEETRRRMSEALKGRKRGPAWNRGVSKCLSEADILTIFKRVSVGEGTALIANDLKIHPGTIYNIIGRRNWAHIQICENLVRNAQQSLLSQKRAVGRGKLSQGEVEEIRSLLKSGMTGRVLASRFGVTPASISLIKRKMERVNDSDL
ncbi:MAG: GIY-YIG nuclease family protein [Armatimonadetes bacterium]|nr:GIY-YIG nuclease family protein [Armatimonadota bacterium]